MLLNLFRKPKVKLIRSQIHLTNRCNLNCIFCGNPQIFADRKDLPDEKWEEIVEDLCELKAKELTISGGGEPLLRRKLLIEILTKVKENGMKTGVITNGTLVSRSFARKIVETRCDEWRTSVHSPFVSTDSRLRGKNFVKKTFDGIKFIAEWKRKLSSDSPKLEIWMVITKLNVNHVEAMIKKAKKIGANSVSLRMVNPPTNKLYPTRRQVKMFIKKLEFYKKLGESYGIEVRWHFSPEEIVKPYGFDGGKFKGITCLLPFHEIVVFADGRVAPCCNFIMSGYESLAIEDVRTKRLKEIWKGKKFKHFRKLMLKGERPERCSECTPDFKAVDEEYRQC